MEARDDLGQPSRPTGQLEREHVLDADVNRPEPLSGGGRAHRIAQRFQRERASVFTPSRHDDVSHACLARGHGLGESGQIEAAEVLLDEMRPGFGPQRDIADFNVAVLRERADRNDAGLEAAKQGDGGLHDRAHLKERAVAGSETEAEERSAHALARIIPFAEGEVPLRRDQRPLLRQTSGGLAQRLTSGGLQPGA